MDKETLGLFKEILELQRQLIGLLKDNLAAQQMKSTVYTLYPPNGVPSVIPPTSPVYEPYIQSQITWTAAKC